MTRLPQAILQNLPHTTGMGSDGSSKGLPPGTLQKVQPVSASACLGRRGGSHPEQRQLSPGG
jgi:hypothetical protein